MTPSPYQRDFLDYTLLVHTWRSIWRPRTMSMSDPKTGWRVPAACRISSLAMLHFDRLRAARPCTLRASGALRVRAALLVNGVGDGCKLSKEVWWESRGGSGLVGGSSFFASSRVSRARACRWRTEETSKRRSTHSLGKITNMT
jgi:hypothetical protein